MQQGVDGKQTPRPKAKHKGTPCSLWETELPVQWCPSWDCSFVSCAYVKQRCQSLETTPHKIQKSRTEHPLGSRAYLSHETQFTCLYIEHLSRRNNCDDPKSGEVTYAKAL